MAPQSTTCECFGSKNSQRPHWTAAKKLCAAGVWVGYLSPDERDKGYKGLPSFTELLRNDKYFDDPYPKSTQGVPGEERHGACQACFEQNGDSQLLTLRELRFGAKRKIAILPLHSDGKQLFCILIPDAPNRSKVATHRLWEHNEPKGVYKNNFIILTPRNASNTNGTIDTIREAFAESGSFVETQSPATPVAASHAANEIPQGTTSNTKAKRKHTSEVAEEETPNEGSERRRTRAMRRTSREDLEISPLHTAEELGSDRRPRGRPRKSGGNAKEASPMGPPPRTPAAQDSGNKPMETGLPNGTGPAAERPTPTTTPIRMSTLSAGPSTPSAFVDAVGELTDEQAKRVHFVWSVDEEDGTVEYVHSLKECSSVAVLFDLFNEDVRAEKRNYGQATGWKAFYPLPDGSRKAVYLNSGNDAAFERLVGLIGQGLSTQTPKGGLSIQLVPRLAD